MSLARQLMARLRGWGSATVPEQERCSFCPQPYVALTTRPIFDDPDGNPAYEDIRRCIDHPPPDTPEGYCQTCGRAYWPDLLHLDCPPDPEPVTVTKAAAGFEPAAEAIERLHEHLAVARSHIGAPPYVWGGSHADPAPEPEVTVTRVTRTEGPIGDLCNTGGHYDCRGCGCTCHPKDT